MLALASRVPLFVSHRQACAGTGVRARQHNTPAPSRGGAGVLCCLIYGGRSPSAVRGRRAVILIVVDFLDQFEARAEVDV
jgi:hypothetical protein